MLSKVQVSSSSLSCDSYSKSILMNPELSIICVNWNSMDYLLECIGSIYEHTPEISYEVIVVDNASTQGGCERLARQYPSVRLVKSGKNLGFAGASNLGFKQSVGTYILLLNPDTRLVGPAINTMLYQLKRVDDAGIIGCKLLNSDLSVSTSSIQTFPTILNQVLMAECLRVRYPNCPLWNIGPLFSAKVCPVRVDVISGACMMLKRNVYEQVGMLDEDYFMYAEDIDLNYKVRKLGLYSYYVGEAQIIHHGGRCSSRQETSLWPTMMTHRAMLRFYRKNRGRVYETGYRVAIGIAAFMRVIVLAIMLPFGDRARIRWAVSRWSMIFRLACGIEQTGDDQ
jgi:GT2 family glycosyltransferase